MKCKKCKKECMENELKNGLCSECQKDSKISLYKKWWFWLCIVAITFIVGFVIIVGIAFYYLQSGINEIALKVQNIDNEATLYTSAGGNVAIVEIPNYTDNTKLEKKNSILQLIKEYVSETGILDNYSTFVLATKMNSDTSTDSLLTLSVYSLPNMTELTDKSKVYYDLVESTTNSLSSKNNTSTSTQATQTPVPTTTAEPTTQTTTNNSISLGQKNALAKAKSYLEYSAFSHKGLVEQLEYEGFSTDEATYGVDNCGADWNNQASKKAKSYMSTSSFSKNSLIEQLEYEGFTKEQAEYGAKAVGY